MLELRVGRLSWRAWIRVGLLELISEMGLVSLFCLRSFVHAADLCPQFQRHTIMIDRHLRRAGSLGSFKICTTCPWPHQMSV